MKVINKQIRFIALLGLVFLTKGCTNVEVNESTPNHSKDATYSSSEDSQVGFENFDSNNDYISETVISWLGADDLHPLVESIFPRDSLENCPANFHEWEFDEGVACVRFKEGFEYRIDDILNSNMIESTRENVE